MKEVKQNEILSLSKSFALRIVRLHRYMVSNKREFVLSQQLLRSGTSIGANIKEAQFAQSKADFIAKMYISLKEAGETEYWLELLNEAGYLKQNEFESIVTPCQTIIRMLSAITKTAKINKSHISHSSLHIWVNDRTFKNFYIFKKYEDFKDPAVKAYMKYFATRNADSRETKTINDQVSYYKADTLIRNKYMTYEYDLHESEEKGIAKAKLEMAAAMLADGDSVEKVVRISKLSEEDVLAIKEKLGK